MCLNTRSLGVGITEEKKLKIVAELSNWLHKKNVLHYSMV